MFQKTFLSIKPVQFSVLRLIVKTLLPYNIVMAMGRVSSEMIKNEFAIFFVSLKIWLFYIPFVKKCANYQLFCENSHYPREVLWMIKISKISFQQNSIFIKLWKSANFIFKSAIFCFCSKGPVWLAKFN